MEVLFYAQRICTVTNHQALRYLKTQTKLNQRHMKWVEFMQSYTFVLNHKSGKTNMVSKHLKSKSRIVEDDCYEVDGVRVDKGRL